MKFDAIPTHLNKTYRRNGSIIPLIHGFGTRWRWVINHVSSAFYFPRGCLPLPIEYKADQILMLSSFFLSIIPTNVHGFRTKFWGEINSRTSVLGSWHTCKNFLENSQPFCWMCSNKMATLPRNQSACNCFKPSSCTNNQHELECKHVRWYSINWLIT